MGWLIFRGDRPLSGSASLEGRLDEWGWVSWRENMVQRSYCALLKLTIVQLTALIVRRALVLLRSSHRLTPQLSLFTIEVRCHG